MESLNGLLLKGWYTKENKKLPNKEKYPKILYIIKHADIFHQSINILPGFTEENGMIWDWERKRKQMPCFRTFDYGNGLKDHEIIAWKPFPKLSKKLKKLIWNRPLYLKRVKG
jgi:hypothetical protein